MSTDNGTNPMRWNCQTQGCFNVKKRPKIERFADCLPGRIAFTDVDGLVEINGNLLLMEWKDHRNVCVGQRILFERLTRFCPATVLIVKGDAESMAVDSVAVAWAGHIGPPHPIDLDGLRRMVQGWAKWAMDNPVTRQPQEAVCA
jgi:hypothetical protein